MSLQKTNLVIQMSRIPATFKGTPDQLSQTMIRRMQILSPSGNSFIFVGDTEPTSNVGPWLRDGTQWWVFDEDIKRYVPLDISASETIWFHVGATTPATSDPPIWLFTTKDPSEEDPTIGSPIGWFVFTNGVWAPFNGIVLSGPTSARPANPVELQQFYDTTISVLIWWERGAWRTVSGVPGDLKPVAFQTLTEALTRNPGWEVFGAQNQLFRGRYISQATKDAGGSPETILTVGPDIPERGAFETYGETDGVDINPASPVPYPPTIALWTLVKL